MSDKEFIPGLIAKAPNPKAPEFVKAGLSIKNAELIEYLQGRIRAGEDWTNVDVKESQGGKWYTERNTFKPESKGGERKPAPSRGGGGGDDGFGNDGDGIPFATNRGMW